MDVLIVETKGYETITAKDIVGSPIVSIPSNKTVSEAISLMDSKGISQLPVVQNSDDSKVIGSINEKDLILHLTKMGQEGLKFLISSIMGKTFPETDADISLKDIERLLTTNSAILIKDKGKLSSIMTKSDLLRFYKGTGK